MAFTNPNGVASFSPRLRRAAARYLGKDAKRTLNPERVVSICAALASHLEK